MEIKREEKLFRSLAGKKENFLILFLAGILLLVIAWPAEEKKKESKYGFWDSQHDTIVSEGSEDASLPEMTADAEAMREYATVMEGQLEDFLSSVEGAGEVKVFLTLKGSDRKSVV